MARLMAPAYSMYIGTAAKQQRDSSNIHLDKNRIKERVGWIVLDALGSEYKHVQDLVC